ncbi:Wzz/FepE/Etk N-terminal domain-containing protein [Emticicia sp. SJ17W-69]|uniref:Wzz/FepE/Etk N-terminal domain-containing protein n=1 Tax=Emticicia sp. SJ17W-69 TaxID=3421657 RepID=UPI003EBF9F76
MEAERDIISIDLKAFFKILWKEKVRIILFIFIFTTLGLVYAFSLREEFISSGKILPEYQSKTSGLGQFAGLASLAGVDLGSAAAGGGDAIRPDLYPDVLKSTPFFLDLFQLKVKTKENKEILFSQFYDQYVLDNDIKEENKKLKFPINNQYIAVSYQTEKNLKDLRERISASIDKKTGLLTVTVKMPDPIVSTLVTRYSMDYLTNYITNYRTEKAKKDLDFLAERLDAAKGKYYNTQAKKAQYSDQYQQSMMKLQSADLQRERIESEYKISSSFYNTLLQKYEEAKLKIQQETPVLKILEPPVVPNKKSEPKIAIIAILSLFLGGITGIIVALFRKKNYRQILR